MNLNKFNKFLSNYKKPNIVIIGLGNQARKDDGAGLLLIDQLQNREIFKKIHFIQVGRTPENYLQKILSVEPELVIFVDSIDCNTSDEISLFTSEELEEEQFSTHSYSIKLIAKYIKKYGNPDIRYLGIPICNTQIQFNISSDVNNYINKFLYSD